jgi:hypothetical protein
VNWILEVDWVHDSKTFELLELVGLPAIRRILFDRSYGMHFAGSSSCEKQMICQQMSQLWEQAGVFDDINSKFPSSTHHHHPPSSCFYGLLCLHDLKIESMMSYFLFRLLPF